MVCGSPCPSGTFGYGCQYTQMNVEVKEIYFDGECTDWGKCDWEVEMVITWEDGTESIKDWSVDKNDNDRYFGGPFTYTHDSNLNEEQPVQIEINVWELDSCTKWDRKSNSRIMFIQDIYEGESIDFDEYGIDNGGGNNGDLSYKARMWIS